MAAANEVLFDPILCFEGAMTSLFLAMLSLKSVCAARGCKWIVQMASGYKAK